MSIGQPFLRSLRKTEPAVGLTSYEVRDRVAVLILLFLIALFMGVILLFYRSLNLEKIPNYLVSATSFLSAALLALSIGSENYYLDLKGQLWFGFGKYVCLGTLLIALLLFLKSNKLWDFQNKYALKILGWVALMVVYIPSAIQPNAGINDIYHSSFVLNEMLAPSADRIPLATFTPQYTSLFGWPLKIFSSGVSLNLAPYFVAFLVLIEFLVIGLITRKFFPRLNLAWAFLIPLAVILVKPIPGNSVNGSIAALMSAIPARTFLPLICGLLLFISLDSTYQQKWLDLALGGVMVLTSINNFEFGVPSSISVFVVLILSAIRNQWHRTILKHVLLGVVATALVLISINVFLSLHFSGVRWTAFVLGFGSNGFGNVPMPQFGTFVLIFMTLGGSAVTSSYVLLKTSSSSRAAVTLYFALWGASTLSYYAGRSVTSGQLQIFLIPAVLAGSGLISLFIEQSRGLVFPSGIRKLPFLILMALPFGAFIQKPDPITEYRRITGNGFQFSKTYFETSETGRHLSAIAYALGRERVAYLGNWGNSIQLSLDIPSVSDQNTLADAGISQVLSTLTCETANTSKREFLLVEVGAIPPAGLTTICPNITAVDTNDPLVHVYRVNKR